MQSNTIKFKYNINNTNQLVYFLGVVLKKHNARQFKNMIGGLKNIIMIVYFI